MNPSFYFYSDVLILKICPEEFADLSIKSQAVESRTSQSSLFRFVLCNALKKHFALSWVLRLEWPWENVYAL